MGLEWNAKWRGYRGIGQYNMMNAWMMDDAIEAAEKNKIYVNMVIHNHGQFSSFSDQQWAYNPFNTINGGYLNTPGKYFTDPRALEAHNQLMHYIVARWGYSPNVFGWELWSELNLTGARYSSYKQPEIRDWHIKMARAIKSYDPNDHIIGTHVSGDHTKQDHNIISLPEMEYCPMDAYHGSHDPLHIVELLLATARHNNPYNKPAIVTEFGGNWYSASAEHLASTLHAGLWTSTATPLSAVPMFWWWELIDEENLYPMFKAVAAFMKGEDYRSPSAVIKSVIMEPADGLLGVSMRDSKRGTGWVYHSEHFRQKDRKEKDPLSGVTLVLNRMAEGKFTVEFWDTVRGQVVATEEAESKNGTVRVPIPPFECDIAFKIRPATIP
jgi:hypothetical protein